jgi:hypothetical protein
MSAPANGAQDHLGGSFRKASRVPAAKSTHDDEMTRTGGFLTQTKTLEHL